MGDWTIIHKTFKGQKCFPLIFSIPLCFLREKSVFHWILNFKISLPHLSKSVFRWFSVFPCALYVGDWTIIHQTSPHNLHTWQPSPLTAAVKTTSQKNMILKLGPIQTNSNQFKPTNSATAKNRGKTKHHTYLKISSNCSPDPDNVSKTLKKMSINEIMFCIPEYFRKIETLECLASMFE